MVKVIIMGSGSPEAMPIATCNCKFCNGDIKRTRPAIIIQHENENYLFDVGPDIREQLLRNNITKINSVFLTHPHFDHVWGIGDLAQLKWVNLDKFDFYISQNNLDFIKIYFPWVDLNYKIYNEYDNIKYDNIKYKDIMVTPIKVEHSNLFDTYGFIIEINNKKIAYLPDLKNITEENISKLKDLDLLITDGQYILGHYIEDDDHIGSEKAIALYSKINAKKTYLIAYSEHWYKKTAKEAMILLPENFIIPSDDEVIIL